jgi:hypothetical protein
MGYPAQVLMIRHGEKLGNSSDDIDGGPDRSLRGSREQRRCRRCSRRRNRRS